VNEYRDLLRTMSRLPGVRGALVGTLVEGLVVDSELMIGVAGEPVAAFTASLLKRTGRSLRAGELGSTDFVQVEAEGGYLFVATPGGESDLFLTVIADPGVSPGIVRVEMRRGVQALS
jgi:predicted regulator of Ras-like GTPase activity (Roadblock/LC7/MglB family)